jgi:Flp pilus assembly protein TadG
MLATKLGSHIQEDKVMLSNRTSGLRSSGQALVEMAILLPLLMLLVMGIFEFGRAMYIKNTLTNAARAGARTAVVTPTIINATGATCASTGNNAKIYQTVCNDLYSGINPSDVTIDVTITDLDSSGTLNSGDMAEVKVNLNNYLTQYRKVPFIPLPNTLTGTTAMRYE